MKITISLRRARIVRDKYAGYEVQVWRLWFPFWVMPGCNTHASEERAEAHAKRWLNHVVKEVTK